jgi:HK97 gp10 family phage protein
MQTGIYLKGIDELEKRVNKLIKEVEKEKTQLLLGQARLVRNRIKARAPRGPTGNLKNATYATALPPSTSRNAVAFAGVRPRKAPHAHLVEYGHGGPHAAPAHPFFRPAWDEIKDKVERNIQAGLGKTIEGAV